MTDNDLIKKLHTLRTIEPNKQWLAFSRTQLLNGMAQRNEQKSIMHFTPLLTLFDTPMRVSFAGAFLAFIGVIGVAAGSQQSIPGDALYSVKRTTEQMEAVLPADSETQIKRDTNLAQRRVDELQKVAQKQTTGSEQTTQMAQAVEKRAQSYQKTLATNSESSKETGVIKESAESLAMVLSASKDSEDFTATLRATIASRLEACKDEEILKQINDFLAQADVPSLIEANELSVRCGEDG